MLALIFTAFTGSPLNSNVGAVKAATLDLVVSLQALCGRFATSELVMSKRAATPRFLCLLGGGGGGGLVLKRTSFMAPKTVEMLALTRAG